jgi:hypothetical protein
MRDRPKGVREIGDDLNRDSSPKLQKVLSEFKDVFPDELSGPTPPQRSKAQLHIDTSDHIPVTGRMYRMSSKS